MTRRATIVINFDVDSPDHAQQRAREFRLQYAYLRNVEVTVLDDGAPPTLPAAPAPGPATSPRSKQ